MSTQFVEASIARWGNGLTVRLSETVVQLAGIEEGTPVRIAAEPGRVVIETAGQKKSLDQLLQAFSLEQHGGGLMPSSSLALGGQLRQNLNLST